MKRKIFIASSLFIVGLVGYVTGIYLAYPGRAFSVTAVMVGIAMFVITQQSTTGGSA